ncbi:MAG TPA: hypothetical protein VF734_09385 [Pseudonocardiaceae bacterium]|jgi:hypothetical protein
MPRPVGEDLYDFGRLARMGVGRAGGALLDDAVLAGIAARWRSTRPT